MLSRQAMFVLSLLFSGVLHLSFFLLAHTVPVYGTARVPKQVLQRFQVELHVPMTAENPLDDTGSAMASRPGSVRDLIAREDDSLVPLDSLLDRETEIPGLGERVASEELERIFDLEQGPQTQKRVDAKILEITQQAARDEIEVARRFVRPSPNRIVEEGTFPVLRSHLAEREDISLRADTPPRSLLAEGVIGVDDTAASKAVRNAAAERPAYEEDVLRPEVVEPELAKLSVEDVIDRTPVIMEVQEAREESAYTFIDDLVEIKLDTFVQDDDPLGYFRLRIVPKAEAQMEVLPKDVTFAIDASGSISQRKLTLTTRGVSEAIDQLRPEDRFNVVVFRDSPTLLRPERVSATAENKAAAHRFLKDLQSRGETDVYRGILSVVREAPRPGVPGVVLVVTDGRPTTGIRDSRAIINGLTADNNGGNSIYALGGGRTVNRNLLDLLAYRNKGEALVTSNIEDIDERIPEFFYRLNAPFLVDLQADYGRIPEEHVFPKSIADFYRGQVVTVYGRFDPEVNDEFVMRLTGAALDREKELIFRANLRDAASGDREIANGWAFQKAYHLIGEISRLGETPELLSELRDLSSTYQIRTSYDE